MKVAMVVSHFDEQYGGHEYYLCRELVKLKHDIVLYTSNRDRPGYGKLMNKGKEYTVEGIKIKRIHAPMEIGEIPFMLGLKKALLQEDFEIIHSHEFFQFCSIISLRAAKQQDLPFILTQHSYKKPLNKSLRIPYLINERTIGKYVMKRADKIIALTPLVKDYLIKHNIPRKNIQVITTGVPIERYSPNIKSALKRFVPDNEKVILFVGRLTENKGVVNLLKAFQKVKACQDNVRLVIVGKGEMEFELKKLAKQLGVEKNTVFIRYVPQKDMPAIYAGAEVFVLPTLYKEPFGIAALEALSSGVPVVASNLGGLSLIVKNGDVGYLTKPGDIEEISSIIIQLLENEQLRRNLARRAREWAILEFSWENKAKEVLRTYEKALAEYL